MSVGNATQPFARLLAAVDAVARDLPQPVIVQAGATPFRSEWCAVHRALPMERFEQLIRESELLILHGGAGSLIGAIRSGKIPVVMPRRAEFHEHIDDHQLELARELERSGRVVVAEDGASLLKACSNARSAQLLAAKRGPVGALMVSMVAEVLAQHAKSRSKAS